jgi:hypothetical protein
VNDLFISWTPAAILTALVSGIAFGCVVHRLRPRSDPRIVGYLAAVLFAFWFVPQLGRLAFEITGTSTTRQAGVFMLAELWFVLPMWLTLRWLNGRTSA